MLLKRLLRNYNQNTVTLLLSLSSSIPVCIIENNYLKENLAEDEKSYENWEGHLYQTYYYPKEQIDYVNNDVSVRGRKVPKSDRDMLKNIIFV